jgi:F-type H+-transporting ATPase subunit b
MNTLLDPESGLILWEIIVFVILVTILRMYACAPLNRILGKHALDIQRSLKGAEDAKLESESILLRARECLAGSRVRYENRISDARVLTGQLVDEAILSAREEAGHIVEKLRHEIQQLKTEEIQRMQAEIGSVIVECAATLLDSVLDAQRHRRIVDSMLEAIPVSGGATK